MRVSPWRCTPGPSTAPGWQVSRRHRVTLGQVSSRTSVSRPPPVVSAPCQSLPGPHSSACSCHVQGWGDGDLGLPARWGARGGPRHHGAGREQLRHLGRDASQVRVAGLERGPHSLPPVGPGSLPRQPRPPADKASGKPCGVQGVPQPAPPRPPPPSRPPAAARAATRAPWSPRGRPLPGDMFTARPSSNCAPVTRASR